MADITMIKACYRSTSTDNAKTMMSAESSSSGRHPAPAMLPIWDNHACMPLRAGDGDFLPQLQRARDNAVSVVSLNIGCMEQTPEEHRAVLHWFRQWLNDRSEDYRIIYQPDDIAAAYAEQKMGIVFDIEGARGIGDRLDTIGEYYALGVRWMLIAYNRENLAGYGCYDAEDLGLKPFGRDMIRQMNAEGMTVCCSHTGARTARDVLDTAIRQVIFSHSNCSAVHAHKRNISDEMISRANNSSFGLSAGLFTNNITRAHRVIAWLEAGTCWINAYNVTPIERPFGGNKQSGLGREKGTSAIEHYTQLKSVYVAMAPIDAPY